MVLCHSPPEVRQERKLSVLTPLVDVFVESRVLNGVIQAPSHHSTSGIMKDVCVSPDQKFTQHVSF